MSSKSGIELLDEISNKLNLLNKRLEIIEQNTKELLSKRNYFTNSIHSVIETKDDSQQDKLIVNNKPVTIKGTTNAPIISDNEQTQTPNGLARVIGRVKSNDGKMISGVNVKVFDAQSQAIKMTKTNKAGEWMCFLPPGKYSALYSLGDIIDKTIAFSVANGEKIVRISQT